MLSYATVTNTAQLQQWFTSHVFYWLLTMWVWAIIQDSCPSWGSGTQSPILKAPDLDLILYFHPCLTGWGKPCDMPNLSGEDTGLNSFSVQNGQRTRNRWRVPGIVTVGRGSIQKNRKYLQEDQTLTMTPLSDG